MIFIKKLFAAPIFDDEIKTQQAHMLHVILWTLICVPIPFVIYTFVLTPENSSRTLLQSAFGEVVIVFLLLMMRRGYVRAASIIQVSVFWLFFTVTAFPGGGVQSESYLLGYGLVIAIAGILLGATGASVLTVLSLAVGGWMVNSQMQGTVNLDFEGSPLTTWVISFVLFPVGVVLQHQASRTLQITLARARASEEKYRLISQVSSDYTFATKVHRDGSASLSWVAGAFKNMTGYTYEEYVASGSWLGHVHPDDLERDAQDMEKLYKNQDIKSEIRTFTKNGEIRWEQIFAHPIWDEKENRLTSIVGAVQDITSSKLAEEKIKETLLQQSAILNGIPDTAWLKDRDSRYIAVNEQFAKTSGMKIKDVIGSTDFEIWQKEFAESYRANDLEVMQTGQRIHIEEPQLDGSGREYWVETIKSPIMNAAGEVIGTVGIAREITERKKAEIERETLITELEAKNVELEQFTYTVSHDLKSPLVTIVGFLAYLEEDARKGDFDRFKQDVNHIEQAVNKMQRLLKDLLELSRIGRMMNPPVEILFTDIVNEALDLVRGQIESGNVVVEICDLQDVRVHGDRTRLVEVVQNLLDNAVKFIDHQSKPLIKIGLLKNAQNERVFFVQDNGVGIAPQYHERIFGLFNKLNSNTEGTGIGLTLVKRIIEVHGGRVWVESQPGEGSTFYFTLP